jgi:hypothetical protein
MINSAAEIQLDDKARALLVDGEIYFSNPAEFMEAIDKLKRGETE